MIIIVLLATTPRSEMHPASYVFGSAGIMNGTGGWNDGIAFLLGLLSVQWTVSNRWPLCLFTFLVCARPCFFSLPPCFPNTI